MSKKETDIDIKEGFTPPKPPSKPDKKGFTPPPPPKEPLPKTPKE